jgi:hypothetical protein
MGTPALYSAIGAVSGMQEGSDHHAGEREIERKPRMSKMFDYSWS